MAEKPDVTTRVRKWAGRISNASPHVLPLGAAVDQTNLRCQTEGQVDVRGGLRPVTFSNAIAATTDEVISCYAFPGDLNDVILYELSSGVLKAGRTPSIA